MTDEKDLDQSADDSQQDGDQSADQAAEPEEVVSGEPEAASGDAESGESASEEAEAASAADVSGESASEEAADVASAVDESGEADKPEDDPSKIVNEDDASEDDAEAAMLAMLEDLPEEEAKSSPDDIDFGPSEVSKAEFQHLQEPAGEQEERNIDMLMDVDLPVSIELGKTKLPIAEILALGPGSVVELNKLAGEPVDLLVNNTAVARGEVVVVDENFGLRITQLMTAEERLQSLINE